MAIKTGEKITAADLTALKEKITTIYNNRSALLSSAQKEYLTSAKNLTFTKDDINTAAIGTLINACLVINDIPNLRWYSPSNTNQGYLGHGDKIVGDGIKSQNLLDWADNIKNAKANSGTHGCRAACLGTCVNGCSTESTGGSPGGDGSGSTSPGHSGYCAQSSCSGNCYYCDTGCVSGCTDTCGSCSNSCSDGCRLSCKQSCGGTDRQGTT